MDTAIRLGRNFIKGYGRRQNPGKMALPSPCSGLKVLNAKHPALPTGRVAPATFQQ